MPSEKKRLGLRTEPRPYIGLDPLVKRMLEILDDLAEIERLRLRRIAALRIKQWKHSEDAKRQARYKWP